MATVSLLPGIDAVNVGDRAFTPCPTGAPSDNQDHFTHVQVDGSAENLCLDRMTTLMQKQGAQSPQHWWYLANRNNLDDLAPLIADETVTLGERLNKVVEVVNREHYYYLSDSDRTSLLQFAEPLLNNSELKVQAALIVCAFANSANIYRLQDRIAEILLESGDRNLQRNFTTALRNVILTERTQSILFDIMKSHLDSTASVGAPIPELPNNTPVFITQAVSQAVSQNLW